MCNYPPALPDPRTVTDDAGSRLSKAGADFVRRGGNDIVEALMDRRSAQLNEDLGALLGRERGGEISGALQIGPFDRGGESGSSTCA